MKLRLADVLNTTAALLNSAFMEVSVSRAVFFIIQSVIQNTIRHFLLKAVLCLHLHGKLRWICVGFPKYDGQLPSKIICIAVWENEIELSECSHPQTPACLPLLLKSFISLLTSLFLCLLY